MSIPSHIIDQIRENAHIEEVVGDFVTLKKNGSSFKACCPFHQEKTPSFVVTPSKGIFKCFGCGKGGDSITFVMEHENMSYPEALRFLAGKYHIEIPEERESSEEQKEEQKHKESLLIVLSFAQKFYTNNLKNTDEGKSIGGSYFKERGFIQKTQEKFELGYAFDEWDSILKAATEKGYTKEYLEDAGLIIKKEDRHYDRFRGRVMFPIHSVLGRVIGFGARALKKDQQPKYLNSPETEVYQKSHILYGIFQAKNAIRKEENCYLVEGYTDVIGLAQAGIENVVASSGTSLTEGQISLLKRFTDRVTLLFDGDKAGLKAAIRGIDIILEQGLDVQAVVLPEGHDPDTFVTEQGGEKTKNYLKSKAKGFVQFTYDTLTSDIDNPIERAETLGEICRKISLIPQEFKRAFLSKELAYIMDADEKNIITEVNKHLHRKYENQIKNYQSNKKDDEDKITNNNNRMRDLNRVNFFLPFNSVKNDIDAEIQAILSENKEVNSRVTFRLYEDEVIRMLVNYGHFTINGGVYICDYILEEINEIPTINPNYSQIRILFENARLLNEKISENWLISICPQDLKEVVVNLLTKSYGNHREDKTSAAWKKRMGIILVHESEQLDKVIPHTILNLKRIYSKGLLYENLREIKRSSQKVQEIEKLLNIYQGLKAQEIEISNQLGIVIQGYSL